MLAIGTASIIASMNTDTAVTYINRYLEYYLTRKDLQYNQGSAMDALEYLDEINGTNHKENFKKLWKKYSGNRLFAWLKQKISGNIIKGTVETMRELGSS